jgi:hypothetical protein
MNEYNNVSVYNRFKPLEYLCEDLDADDLEEIKENEDVR